MLRRLCPKVRLGTGRPVPSGAAARLVAPSDGQIGVFGAGRIQAAPAAGRMVVDAVGRQLVSALRERAPAVSTEHRRHLECASRKKEKQQACHLRPFTLSRV
jgi:hypothetical protein